MAETAYEPFELDLNLENTDAWDGQSRPLVPVGTYASRIVSVANKAGKIEVKFEITEGDQAGAFVWNNYNTDNDTGLKRLRHLMDIAGASLGKFNSEELMDASMMIDITHNPGKSRPDANGNPQEPKLFANVSNERKIDQVQSTAPAEPPPPPVTKEVPAASATGTRRTGPRRS